MSTVPVVPNGVAASSGVTWRKACYLQFHCGVFGAHRSAEKTYAVMKRVVWWATMKEDINSWVGKCLTCFKARPRATKVTTKPMKPAADYCWQEVSVDCEGPNKEDYAGNRYSLTYMDCLSHAVYLEPLRALNHAEVRRAFARCVLRSRTLPTLVRSDRGPEFRSAMFAEYCALIGASQWLSHPLRPCEMGANERVHQEVQKMLGIVVKDVARGHTDHWGDLLAVVEYCIDTTPGPHGYTPRDLDRAWSLGVPLEKDLLKSALEFEPVSDWARKIFGQYMAVSKVVKDHLASASEARVRLANRYRREVDLKIGDRVVWSAPGLSDPGAKGRVPWKKGLTGPWEVVSCKGNRLQLAGPDGAQPLAAHAEDCVLIPDDVCGDARDEIQFDSDPDDSRPSLGQMIKGETKQVEFTMKRRGKQYVLKIGDVIAFRKGYGPKLCAIGRVTSVAVSEGVVHVHKYAPEIGGLRVKWCLLYLDQQGQESLAPEGGRPCIEEVKMSLLITKVELSRDGILQASSARKLDKGGYRLEERPPAQRNPERRGEHEYSEPLDDLVGILKGGKTESGVGVFAAGPSDGFAREQKAVLEYLRNEGVPQHGVDFLEVFAGHGGLTKAARRRGLLVGEPVDRLYRSYGRDWDLRKNSDRALLAWLISKVMKPKVLHVGAPCEKLSRLGEQTPSSEDLALAEFSCDLLSHQEKANGIGTLENPVGSLLFSLELFVKRFGTLVEPRRPWAMVRTDSCQYNMTSLDVSDGSFGNPVEKGQIWVSNSDLSGFSLRCRKPDALLRTLHQHRQIRGSMKIREDNEPGLGPKWAGAGKLSGIYPGVV